VSSDLITAWCWRLMRKSRSGQGTSFDGTRIGTGFGIDGRRRDEFFLHHARRICDIAWLWQTATQIDGILRQFDG